MVGNWYLHKNHVPELWKSEVPEADFTSRQFSSAPAPGIKSRPLVAPVPILLCVPVPVKRQQAIQTV